MLRQSFDLIHKKYAKIQKGNIRLTQSELVLMQPINITSTNYKFLVLENEGTILSDEVRLNINDEFIITHLGIYLGCKIYNQEVKGEPIEWLTYPAFDLFGQRAVAHFPLWNGYLKIDVNNVNYVDKWYNKKHQIYTNHQALYSLNSQTSQFPTIEYKKDAIYPVQPMVTLSGAKKNDIQMFLPNALGSVNSLYNVGIDANIMNFESTHIIVMLRGFLAQNGAKFQ